MLGRYFARWNPPAVGLALAAASHFVSFGTALRFFPSDAALFLVPSLLSGGAYYVAATGVRDARTRSGRLRLALGLLVPAVLNVLFLALLLLGLTYRVPGSTLLLSLGGTAALVLLAVAAVRWLRTAPADTGRWRRVMSLGLVALALVHAAERLPSALTALGKQPVLLLPVALFAGGLLLTALALWNAAPATPVEDASATQG